MVGRNALIEGLLSIEIAPGQINYIVFSVSGFNHHTVISGIDKKKAQGAAPESKRQIEFFIETKI
jgi:hypothetical protein